VEFATNSKTCINLIIGYDNKKIEKVLTAKFPGLQIYNKTNWKKHIEYIIPKLCSACFAIRTVTPLMKTDTLKLVCLLVIFWGNSTDSKRVFNICRKIIRTTCRC
jgi:hypothetical protein